MQNSETIADLAAALTKAQATLEGAAKGKVNPAFKSKYADLAAVWDACREALTANGLSVVQAPGPMIENCMSLTTMLLHSSGQWISETLTIPLTKTDAQGYGSATTYARRYALAAMVGVSPEDDDGNGASQLSRSPSPPTGVISGEQLEELQDLAGDVGADVPKFCQYLKVSSLAAIPANEFSRARQALEAKRKRAA
jgi:hypothetical protein